MGYTKVINTFPSLQVPPPNDLQMVLGGFPKVVLGFRSVDMGCGPVWLLPFDKQGNRGPERLSNLLSVLAPGFQRGQFGSGV